MSRRRRTPDGSPGAVDHALVERVRARVALGMRDGPEPPEAAHLSAAARRVLDEERVILPHGEREGVVQAVVDSAVGLGPIGPLLRDPAVSEIMVNGPSQVFIERAGRIERTDVVFADADHVLHVVDRILSPIGRRVDEASPMVDARLADGSRVNVVVAPLALDGPVLTIRRFGRRRLTAEDLLRLRTVDARVLVLLRDAVTTRRNILVTGGTGSGKTTTLAVIAGAIPDGERVITIEDAAELQLPLRHVVRLESRPASLENRGAVPIRALVRNALRMRPDRIIVGEVRGGEALDMLTAMTTGHEGSLCTLHASSPRDALARLQVLALMAGVDLPYAAVAEQVARAIDVVVHQVRLPDGTRRVAEVAEVESGGAGPTLRALARWSGADGGFELTDAGRRAADRWRAASRTDGFSGEGTS